MMLLVLFDWNRRIHVTLGLSTSRFKILNESVYEIVGNIWHPILGLEFGGAWTRMNGTNVSSLEFMHEKRNKIFAKGFSVSNLKNLV